MLGGSNMENTLEIYFRDFLPETQGAILETAGIQDPKDANWDLIPITILSFEAEEGGSL